MSNIPYDKMSSAPPPYDEEPSMSLDNLEKKSPAYTAGTPMYPPIPAYNPDEASASNPQQGSFNHQVPMNNQGPTSHHGSMNQGPMGKQGLNTYQGPSGSNMNQEPYNPQTSHHQGSQGPITQQPGTTIIVNTVGPGNTPFVGPRAMFMSCPNCQQQIKTDTTTNYKCCAICCCWMMFLTGICTLCSCLPYCMDSCKIVTHKCPNCKADLGTYRAA